MKAKKELLIIDDPDVLKSEGVEKIKVTYRQRFLRRILSLIFSRYKDIKYFDIHDWVAFREGIIENLYDKKLCKIEFQ